MDCATVALSRVGIQDRGRGSPRPIGSDMDCVTGPVRADNSPTIGCCCGACLQNTPAAAG